MKSGFTKQLIHILLLLFWVLLLGMFFAKTEIQIEGANGWAASLPTWRIEKHLLLDIFWGGRAMTGYHAWVFSFMFLAFHLPHVVQGRFSWRMEARCIAALMIFWIAEDFLWFVLNPAFGLARFSQDCIPWHKHWMLGVPTDYLTYMLLGGLLLAWSFLGKHPKKMTHGMIVA
ncbi:MAG TPA: hypothetical protein VGJ93_14570 [Desulfuromonadaceae bacterium]|jgi:hypothetical protein